MKNIIPLLLLVLAGNQSLQAQTYRYGRYPAFTAQQAASGYRYCYNPQCVMCNRIFGPMDGYTLLANGKAVKATVPPRPATPVFTQPTIPMTSTPAIPAPAIPAPVVSTPVTPKTVSGLDLDPSDPEIVSHMLKVLNPKRTDILYDPGCGDARILIQAAKIYGCRGIGIELNPETAKIAKQKVREAGLDHMIEIIEGDILKHQNIVASATLVTLYLYPDLIQKLWPLLPEGARVISNGHELPVESQHLIIATPDYEIDLWTTTR